MGVEESKKDSKVGTLEGKHGLSTVTVTGTDFGSCLINLEEYGFEDVQTIR